MPPFRPFGRPHPALPPFTLTRCLALLLGGLSASLGHAALPDAGQLLKQQQQQPLSAPLPRETAPATQVPTPAPQAQQGLVARITAITFSGATHLAPLDTLHALVADALNQDLDHAQLQALALRVTQYLRGQGFVLARAFLPRQDLTDGRLEISIQEGRLQSSDDRIVLKTSTRLDPARLKAIAQAALPRNQALRQQDLERAVLLMNDQPGITARTTLEKGDEPGTSRLVVTATQDDPVQGLISADNFGSRSTGLERVTAQVRVLDPSGRGDRLTLSTTQSRGTQTYSGQYTTPLNADGLQLQLAGSHLAYSVGAPLQALELTGRAVSVSTGVSYPLLRTRERNLAVQAVYEVKMLKDDAMGVNLRERRLHNVVTSLTGSLVDGLGGGGFNDGSLSWTHGDVGLQHNPDDAVADAASARTQGHFDKLNVQLSRFQNLGLSEDWTAFLALSGQLASRNLDSSEKFILGGPTGVRAYAVGEAAGDAGWLGTLELRRKLTLPGVTRAQALLFVDTGAVRLHRSPWTGSLTNAENRNDYPLAGWGLGLNLAWDKWFVQSAVALPLGHNPGRNVDGTEADGKDSQIRAWLQATRRFD